MANPRDIVVVVGLLSSLLSLSSCGRRDGGGGGHGWVGWSMHATNLNLRGLPANLVNLGLVEENWRRDLVLAEREAEREVERERERWLLEWERWEGEWWDYMEVERGRQEKVGLGCPSKGPLTMGMGLVTSSFTSRVFPSRV